jgi:hypothetical protein
MRRSLALKRIWREREKDARRFCGQRLGYVENLRGKDTSTSPSASNFVDENYFRENPDTRKIIPTLLQPSNLSLAPEIVAEYVLTAAKIFGTWVVELAQAWDDETDLPEVRRTADMIVDGLRPLASHSDYEVQERVRACICAKYG